MSKFVSNERELERASSRKMKHKSIFRKTRSKRCGVSHQCQIEDCGECRHCRDMHKFGGNGKSKQACEKRRCVDMTRKESEKNESIRRRSREEISSRRERIVTRRRTHEARHGDSEIGSSEKGRRERKVEEEKERGGQYNK